MPVPLSKVALEKFTTFGDLLKYLRRRAGLTQLELSIAVAYSDTYLSRLEQNQRLPDPAVIAARFVPALRLEHEPELAARLLELAALANIASDHPPAHPPPCHNLPSQLTRFIGREQAIAEVKRLLVEDPRLPPAMGGQGAASRLVTLTGPGGCGKTRLALEIAADLVEAFADGVWLVELAPASDPVHVSQAVATVVGAREQPGRSLTESLSDHLRARHMLLVLDNCEHVIEGCARLAEVLLRAGPGLKILATSREVLGIMGEAAWPVPSLSLPALPEGAGRASAIQQSEAVQLFADRAVSALPTFRISEANALAVAQVCRRLDGIPLAIELAAVRVRALPVEQIAVRLASHDRFRLLIDGDQAAPPRQQTLRATLDWSYDLLSAAEQALLRRLSVFTTAWTLEAAETVCADVAGVNPEGDLVPPGEVVDLLTRLVNKSLVIAQTQGGEAQYRFLDTIRQYARERLEGSGEEALFHGRYRWWRWRNRVKRQVIAHQR